MRRYGLIGYPLTQSFSERYFAEKFRKENIRDVVYQNFQVHTVDELPSLLRAYPDLRGLNVTIPYKEQVIPFLTSQADVVRDTGACNCIRIAHTFLEGYNTDVIGFERSLKNFLDADPGKALILGTGGSAKAIAYVLKRSGISFSFVSRNPAENQVTYAELTKEITDAHRLIINTTPLGMYPVEKAPDIPYQYLGRHHYLFDLIYNPAKTVFLQKGEERGARIKNGLEMLEIQAEESWRIWNG